MKRLLCSLLALVVLLGFGGCGGNESKDNRNMVIAVMDNHVVFDADDSYLNGVAMAIEDVNAIYGGSGYSFRYEFYDDQSDFQSGIAIANKLASDDEVSAVLGTSSLNILDVTADILDSAGKVLVMYYGSNESVLDNGYTHVFRNTFGSEDLGKAIAKYSAKSGDVNRVAVYHSETQYEKDIIHSFLRQASKEDIVVTDIAVTSTLPADIDEMIQKWLLLDVDTVFISQYFAENAFAMLRSVRTAKPEMNILGDFSFDYVGNLMDNIDISNDIRIANLLSIKESEKTKEFYRRYQEKYGTECSHWAIQMYDSVRMIADTAYRIGSTDSKKIAEALHADGYQGIGGFRKFDSSGRMIEAPVQILTSKDGAFYITESLTEGGSEDAGE